MIFMKKLAAFVICLVCLALLFCACDPGEEEPPEPSKTQSLIDVIENPPTPFVTIKPTPTVDYRVLVTASPSPLPTHTVMPTPSPTLAPPQNPSMYDSDAFLVSFDASTGFAEFDFIVILQGDAAVQYMVSNQGKTLQEAQDIVDDWADSECIIKNDNPQLRTINMTSTDITMLFYPDGSEDYTLSGVSFTYNDFVNLYQNNFERIEYYLFYHIDVDSAGDVLVVSQVYWP